MPEINNVPIVKLSPQQKTDLEGAKSSLVSARKELAVLKKLGMDVKVIEDKLNWADEVQSTLLKEFGQ